MLRPGLKKAPPPNQNGLKYSGPNNYFFNPFFFLFVAFFFWGVMGERGDRGFQLWESAPRGTRGVLKVFQRDSFARGAFFK